MHDLPSILPAAVTADRTELDRTVSAAVDALASLQREEGEWAFALEADATRAETRLSRKS